MSDSEEEICPGCLSPYTYKIGHFVTKTARIIPGCSHDLCEDCIVKDGIKNGQVTCRYPSCSTQVLWTDRRIEQFIPDLFILGSVAYRQQTFEDASEDIIENVEPLDDTCEMMCGQCGQTADGLCQQCNINVCDNCFDKIHEFVKGFDKHKKLPIATDFIEKKMVPFLKMSNCNDHSKMIQYVADDGSEGCDECVIFGKLQGLHVVKVKEVEEKAKNNLKAKVVEGKDRLNQLRASLSDLESEKVKEMNSSPEKMVEKIKSHFSDCHSKLQILEHSLLQKLQKDHADFNVWRFQIESSVKSTASKIKELSNMIKFSEEALSKDFNAGTYDFNEMVNCLDKLGDDPCEATKINNPGSRCLRIDQSFMNLLDNHVSVNHNQISQVHLDPSEHSEGYSIKNCNVVISRIALESSGNLHNKPKKVVNSFERPSPVPSSCGDISNNSTSENGDIAALNENGSGHTVDTTSESLVGQHVIDHCNNLDEVQSYDTTTQQSNEKNTATKRFKRIKTRQKAKYLSWHVESPSTSFNSSSHPKTTPSVSEKCQDGNNNVDLCSDVNELDACKMRTLRRKRLSTSSYFEGSGDDDKSPASKKVRILAPSRNRCSDNVSDRKTKKLAYLQESNKLSSPQSLSNSDESLSDSDEYFKELAAKKKVLAQKMNDGSSSSSESEDNDDNDITSRKQTVDLKATAHSLIKDPDLEQNNIKDPNSEKECEPIDANISNLPPQNENRSINKTRNSKKVKNPVTSGSNNISDLSCPSKNTIKIKPGTSKKVRKQSNEMKIISNLLSPNENMYKVSNDMKDRCKTKCKICNDVYSLSSMKAHTQNKHNLKVTEYKEIHGPLDIIDVVYHKCQLCGKLILLDGQSLGNHVRKTHSMKIRWYVNEYMVRTTKLDLNQIKNKLSQKSDTSSKSKKHAKKSADKKDIRTSSGSSRNISGSSVKKFKIPRKEDEAPLTEPQPSREKSNQVKRLYRPGNAALMAIRKFHKTTKIVVPKVPFFKLIEEAAKKVIDVNKRSSLKIEADAIDCLREAAEARWDDLIVDALYASRVKRVARMRKDVILASKIRGAWDGFS